jgi:hypothetical protein
MKEEMTRTLMLSCCRLPSGRSRKSKREWRQRHEGAERAACGAGRLIYTRRS